MTTDTAAPETTEAEGDGGVVVTRDEAFPEVTADLRNAVTGYLARADDADRGAQQMEESAALNRRLAAEYRAKAEVLREHIATLGI